MDQNKNQPLAEIFGFPISNESSEANNSKKNLICPYNNIIQKCTKNSKTKPLGVCALYHKGNPVIICPVRFRENWIIIEDAAKFIFDKKCSWTHIGEVRLKGLDGKSAGNIDYVLASYNEKGEIIDFGSLEVQAVYISGNLTDPFDKYMSNPSPNFNWNGQEKYPNPDYLSSSRKRLIPQIIAKGTIFKQWGKKQAVALQTSFYATLPSLPEVDQSDSDFAFFLYELVLNKKSNKFELTLEYTIYTKFSIILEHWGKFEAGSVSDFTKEVQSKLKKKLRKG